MTQDAPDIINTNTFQQLTAFLSSNSFSQTFVLVDENTMRHCYAKISASLQPLHHLIEIKSGETNKTLQTCETIWKKLTDENADRKSLLINLGGGVIGDMGGFAAGCYKRGIKFINIPTTLLAMVDASVGGKTGVDFLNYKNQIGLFNEPEAVFIYEDFLNTLPPRELLSGFAEVIKHYLIADAAEFKALSSHTPLIEMLWSDVIAKNIAIKSNIVKQDLHEQNIRKALNFGHTIGHAVETCFLTQANHLLHGEAVAIGMICESFISFKLNQLSDAELQSIAKLILHYFRLAVIEQADFKEVLRYLNQDKKNDAKQNQFTLLKGIGNYTINTTVREELIIESLNYYNSLL